MGAWGGSPPPFSAGQLAVPRTTGELLLLNTKTSQTNNVGKATSDTPQKFGEGTSLVIVAR